MKKAKPVILVIILVLISFSSCKQPYPIDAVVSLPDYKKGEALMGVNNDSAFYYFNQVVNTAKDSLEIATSLNNMAAIQSDAGDYFGSQESLLLSLQYLNESRERDYYCLSSDYNELGNSSLNLRNYDAAIRYYDLAIKFSKDDNFKTVLVNNKALAFQKKGAYGQAIALYSSITEQSKADRKRDARVITNLAMTKWMQDSVYHARPELMTALHIREAENDKWGLNSSYAHLSDYYAHKNTDSALKYAQQMNRITQELNSPDDEMESLQKLIILNESNDAKPYFIRYQYLNDSVQSARNNAKNQFALIRYDAERHMVDNFRLERDNTQKKLLLVGQRILLYCTIAALILGTAGAVLWYRKRRQKMLWESQQAIREQQLKTSQKVHDVVANGLYRIMAEIEHRSAIDKEHLLDKIEALYESSRDISYEAPAGSDQGFDQSLAKLLLPFASDDTKVLVAGNDASLWTKVSPSIKQQLEPILQELMVNMNKHSRASNVVIKFEQLQQEIKIHYIDDGVGLSSLFKYGNGLRNTENRIKAIGGRIIFDADAPKGLKIEVYIPINR